MIKRYDIYSYIYIYIYNNIYNTYLQILLGRSGLIVMMLRPRNHA